MSNFIIFNYSTYLLFCFIILLLLVLYCVLDDEIAMCITANGRQDEVTSQ